MKLSISKRYQCPCCGYYTFESEPNGDYGICPVCYWEDDGIAYDNPDEVCDCNGVSLNEARKNYLEFGACREDMVKYVRKPRNEEL